MKSWALQMTVIGFGVLENKVITRRYKYDLENQFINFIFTLDPQLRDFGRRIIPVVLIIATFSYLTLSLSLSSQKHTRWSSHSTYHLVTKSGSEAPFGFTSSTSTKAIERFESNGPTSGRMRQRIQFTHITCHNVTCMSLRVIGSHLGKL